jgi:hypothetical protein
MSTLKVKIAGREVTFQSEDDFARALSALERVDEAPEKNGKARNTQGGKTFNPLLGTLSFLEEIVSHRENGVHSSVIAQALDCSPRGIGRRLMEVDNTLKALGFKRDSVYDHSKRIAEGGRMYVPKADAGPALEAVKRRAGS